jgi:hypothetical protein
MEVAIGVEPYQEKIIQQMVTQEKLLSKMYALFAQQFPEYAEFWGRLSKEEESHSKLIEKLWEAEDKGLVSFEEGKIKTYTLELLVGRLQELVEKAEKGDFTLPAAFAHAVDYETALIEKNIFTHFDSSNEKIKRRLKMLQDETLDHVERIKQTQQEAIGSSRQ